MKKSIEMPIVNVIRYEAKDVITTSGTMNQGGIDPNTNQPEHFATPKFAEGKALGTVDPGRLVW